jgi:hypothetical protein
MAAELNTMNTNFDRLQDTVMTSVQSISEQIHESFPSGTQEPNQEPTQAPTQPATQGGDTMNATTNSVNAEMLRLIQQMQQQMANMHIDQGTPGGRGTNGGRGNSGGRGPGNQTRRTRRNVSKYCWTHGACAHSSSECTSKADNHQDAATFANKMGGSTAYCRATE